MRAAGGGMTLHQCVYTRKALGKLAGLRACLGLSTMLTHAWHERYIGLVKQRPSKVVHCTAVISCCCTVAWVLLYCACHVAYECGTTLHTSCIQRLSDSQDHAT